jgi:hypothetical protein
VPSRPNVACRRKSPVANASPVADALAVNVAGHA